MINATAIQTITLILLSLNLAVVITYAVLLAARHERQLRQFIRAAQPPQPTPLDQLLGQMILRLEAHKDTCRLSQTPQRIRSFQRRLRERMTTAAYA